MEIGNWRQLIHSRHFGCAKLQASDPLPSWYQLRYFWELFSGVNKQFCQGPCTACMRVANEGEQSTLASPAPTRACMHTCSHTHCGGRSMHHVTVAAQANSILLDCIGSRCATALPLWSSHWLCAPTQVPNLKGKTPVGFGRR